MSNSKLKRVSRGLRPRISALTIRALGPLPLRLNRRLGAMIGRVAIRLAPRTVAICRDNLRRCFPHLSAGEREHLLRESIIHTAMTAAEAPSIWAQPYRRLGRFVTTAPGFERIHQHEQNGRGLLLLVPHLGNWEIMGPVLPHHLSDITFMFQPTGMEPIDNIMVRGRSKDGVKLTPASRAGVAQVLRVLAAGGTVAILPDQVPAPAAGREAPFFGQAAFTMTLIHKLIRRTGCETLVIFGERVKSGFRLHVREPDAEIAGDDLDASLAAMNRAIEDCVREVPAQYQWEYKRFKKIASGTAGLPRE